MEQKTKIMLALYQIGNVTSLIQDNEWKQFLVSHLIPIKYELERQLTLQDSSDSIME